VHIAVIDKKGDMMWNGVQTGNDGMSDHWNRQQGSKVTLITYTNADEVEVFVNGKSMGTKQNDKKNAKTRNQIRCENIPYANGYCEAVAKNNGKIVARHKIETTGEAVKLVAIPDNNQWKADGTDLQHIRVYAVDKKGRRVYHAQQQLTFSISEGAEIVAVSNGDQKSNELNVTNKRSLNNGSALVILRAGRKASKPVLTIEADGFKTVKTKLQTL
jgi:beta-galactosidase